MTKYLFIITAIISLSITISLSTISCGKSEKFDMSDFNNVIIGKWKLEMNVYKLNNDQDKSKIDADNYKTLNGYANINKDGTYDVNLKGALGEYIANGNYSVEATSLTLKPKSEKFGENIVDPKETVYAFVTDGDKLKSSSTDKNGMEIYTYWHPVK